jgi:SseB protein C-terminal domain
MMEFLMRSLESTIVTKLRFLGEQEGHPEQMLKEKLTVLFDLGRKIDRAYLARVHFENRPGVSVTLCLRAHSDGQEKILNSVSTVFSNLFNTKEHLDIIFISDEQETQLRGVCRPFYIKKPGILSHVEP